MIALVLIWTKCFVIHSLVQTGNHGGNFLKIFVKKLSRIIPNFCRKCREIYFTNTKLLVNGLNAQQHVATERLVCAQGLNFYKKQNKFEFRECKYQGFPSHDCPGTAQDQAPCQLKPCPSWGSWSDWGSCSASCGHGQEKRYLRKHFNN